MTVPKFNEFFPAIMTFISDGREHTINEISDYCADSFNLSENDRNERIPSGENMIYNRVSWAKSYLKKAGLLESVRRAAFIITPLGKKLFTKGADIFTLEYIRELQNKTTTDTQPVESKNVQSPQEVIHYAMAELKAELVDELLITIRSMNEYDFERVVADLLIKMGYGSPGENRDAVTKKSGDEGIDGIVKADRFGFDAVYTQAKKWKEDSHIGQPEIQKFLGAMAGQGATKGLFITTGQFSKGARDFVTKQLNHKIVLVDGKQLAELMIEYNLGVATVKTYEIKRIDSDYFTMNS